MTAETIHHAGPTTGRAYCGRKTKTATTDTRRITCADCAAAIRADHEARKATP